MNTEFEELVRDSMEWSTADLQVPPDLAGQARRAHRRHRQLTVRAVLACGTAAVTAAALIAATGGAARTGTGGGTNTQTTAYVIKQVQNALADANFVIQGRTTGSNGLIMTWTYGNRWRMEQFTGNDCGHARPDMSCSHRGGVEPYWDQGTALISGKLVDAYVTYWNHSYSLSPFRPLRLKACSTTAQLVLGGAETEIPHWPAFIKTMLGCEAATVTGHVQIGGVPTIVISGSADVPLSKGYGRVVQQKRVRVRYTLYVDSATYLPVRAVGYLETYGGAAGPDNVTSVTDVRWLRPTPANTAKALVPIPPGYQLRKGPATNQ